MYQHRHRSIREPADSLFPGRSKGSPRLPRRYRRYLLCPWSDRGPGEYMDRRRAVRTLAKDPSPAEARKSSHTYVRLRRIHSAGRSCGLESANRSCYEPSERLNDRQSLLQSAVSPHYICRSQPGRPCLQTGHSTLTEPPRDPSSGHIPLHHRHHIHGHSTQRSLDGWLG